MFIGQCSFYAYFLFYVYALLMFIPPLGYIPYMSYFKGVNLFCFDDVALEKFASKHSFETTLIYKRNETGKLFRIKAIYFVCSPVFSP